MDLGNIYRWMLAFLSIYGYATTVYIRGIIDSTITFNCSLRGLSTKHSAIIWTGPPYKDYYSVQNHIYVENIPEDLKPRIKIVGNFPKGLYNLQIKDLHPSDTGFYICHRYRSKRNEYFYLVVIELNVTVSKPSYVGEIGSSITLGCSISSKSSNVSEVRWYFHSNRGYHPLETSCNAENQGKPTCTCRTGKYSKPTPVNPSLTIEKLDLNDVGPYMCSATNQDGLTVNSTTTTLSLLDSKEIRKVVFILGLICFLLVLLFVTGLVLRKNKPMFFLQIAYTFQRAEDDDSKLWDAFISFKSQDADHQFVSSKLYMKLETQLAIANNIVDSIANSRRTILIISREYLQGGYTTFELEMAHAEMISTKSKHKIIPVLLDKYENLQGLMDDTLKHIIQSVTYITWPGETSQRDVKAFWKRLELSMPKKSRKLCIRSDENTPLLSSWLDSSA
ncbi:unnamed protein product [Mytilus edulis]|uniref:Uncharacterized protein n=1 Tax=Mytilus edulis TaxID=6550 RepID=A0A8S3VQK0_MYTED|nr:unnamed protein product [Mytilus edulis]